MPRTESSCVGGYRTTSCAEPAFWAERGPTYTRLSRIEQKEPTLGIGDFVDKAKDLAAEHEDKVSDGIDKVADMVDDKTGGKYSDQIDQGADKAKDLVEDLDND